MVEKVTGLMQQKDKIRNMGIAAHIDHGKTTLSDNLLSGCGIISEELSGKQCFMDWDEQEKARGITINAANVSMVHPYGGKEYLVNLIDTPGHVDFSGEVTRSMRAVDGAIIVVCAVEGIMPQTKTVVGQALKERVKPLLFINKVDRMINELKLTPEAMQEKFVRIVNDVNKLISQMAPEQFKKEWLVDIKTGKVAFGSAYNNWATSVPYMQKVGLNFKDIIEYCRNENQKELAKKTKLLVMLLGISAVLNIVLNIALIPPMGILGAAVATLISYATLGISTLIVSRRYLKFPINLVFITKSLASSAVMALCIWLINPESIALVIVSILAGIIIYFGTLFALKGLSRGEIRFFVGYIAGFLRKIRGKA